jgi:mono/diheme cytochrome c family protein
MNASMSRIFAVALLGLAACGGGEDLTPELVQGRALYETNCAMCHGDGARGDGPMAASLPVPPPSILEHLGHHTSAQLVGLIRGGVPPAMPPAPISEAEVQLVVDYVWSLVPESEATALRAMRDQMEAMEQGMAPGHMMPAAGDSSAR